jgi:lysozyme
MTVSNDLIEFVKGWERLKLRSSEDPLVPGVFDVGYGHVIHHSQHPMTITREQAHDWLVTVLEDIDGQVRQIVTVPTLDNEREALVSFAYNVGVNALGQSTLLALLNSGDSEGAAGQFGRWNKAGGRMILGLAKRRRAEQAMFKHGDYSGRP